MSITNLTTNLTNFNPGYNNLVYGFDSTNKNQPGFRYVVDVYLTGTATKIYEARVAPRPVDGYGYIDLSKIISDYLTYNLDTTNTTSMSVLNSYLNYDVKIGEEYIVSWTFTDSNFYSGNITQITQTPNTISNTFAIGDQIVVSQTTPTNFPQLEGLQTVNTVIDAYNFTIDIPFVVSVTNPGIVKYADNRKTIFRALYTYSRHTAFNGALSFKDWPSYVSTDYKIDATSTTKKLLTNIPLTNFYAKTGQDIWINWAPFLSSVPIYVLITNSNGDVFSKTITNTTEELRQFSIGPNNVGALTTLVGTPGLVKSNTTWYEFAIVTLAYTQMSQKYRINIDTRCNIEDHQILFQDRLGSFVSYSFSLRSKETGTVKRESFNRQIGDISGAKWTYATTDQGMVNTNVSVEKDYELTTDWMNNEMNVYFEELVTSPVTYVKMNNIYYSCIITDTSFEVQSSNYKKLIKKTIKLQLSSENIINI